MQQYLTRYKNQLCFSEQFNFKYQVSQSHDNTAPHNFVRRDGNYACVVPKIDYPTSRADGKNKDTNDNEQQPDTSKSNFVLIFFNHKYFLIIKCLFVLYHKKTICIYSLLKHR